MLIFLHGQDTCRLKRKLREIEDGYRRTYGDSLSLEKLDCCEVDWRGFLDIFSQPSMFVKKKLLILENVFANPAFTSQLIKKIGFLADLPDIVVLVEETGIAKSNKLFLLLREKAKTQEFVLLTGAKLKQWVCGEFAEYQTQITDGALEKLIGWAGPDLWRLSNEIAKLSAFSKNIIEKDVELLVEPPIETAIFKTTDALSERKRGLALKHLQSHLQKGENPIYLLSMFVFSFRNLLLAKMAQAGGFPVQKLGLHPFVARKSLMQASRFSFEELKTIYGKLGQIDLAVKTGQVPPEMGLKTAVAFV
ncbi:MAG: DNA polymerase III subunit delta [Patescibacteria group bacterium]|nr:DNA polymerase III subunit delta [Patescibacteria group bacterium]